MDPAALKALVQQRACRLRFSPSFRGGVWSEIFNKSFHVHFSCCWNLAFCSLPPLQVRSKVHNLATKEDVTELYRNWWRKVSPRNTLTLLEPSRRPLTTELEEFKKCSRSDLQIL